MDPLTNATPNDEEFAEIGGYTIVEKLREGGMATLYLGTRGGAHGFTRPVAIKVMQAHVAAQPRMTQMFVDEALLGSHLQHPNIGHVEEFGEELGRYYLVMEYIDGCSISDFRRHHRHEKEAMSPSTAAYIISQAALGLHYAHGAKDAHGVPLDVVHRDVSPGNILVSRSGHVKVIDFGVAKSELRTKHTIASLKGKFRYMSPEQARGKNVDARSDVYCLGLILWELLCNRGAIQGKSDLQLLESARNPKLAPVTDHSEASDELAEAVEKALAVSPDERWDTALEFSHAISAALPQTQTFDPSELGTQVQRLPQGGRSHVALASSSELSQAISSRSQSSSELRRRESLIPDVDVEDPHDPNEEKRRRLIVGALIAIAVVVFLFVAIPTDETVVTPPLSEGEVGAAAEEEETTNTVEVPEDTDVVAPREEALRNEALPEERSVQEFAPPAERSSSGRSTDRGTGAAPPRARRGPAVRTPDQDTRLPDAEQSVRTQGDSRPEQVGGILLDTGGEDDTRPRRRQESSVQADGILLAD